MCQQSPTSTPAYFTSTLMLIVGIALIQPAMAFADQEYESVSYRLAPGQTIGYTVKIEVRSPESSQYIGGVACFWGETGSNRVVNARSRDNLRLSPSENAIPYAFPTSSSMLKENFAVNKYGEPLTSVNGSLPMLLGDLEELLYPPLPNRGSIRSESRDIYHYGDGQFKFYGSRPEDSRLQGKFNWSTSYVGRRGDIVNYIHQRQLATGDQRYWLVAQGPIEVDAATGRLRSHHLNGECLYKGQHASFSIGVIQLSNGQLRELAEKR